MKQRFNRGMLHDVECGLHSGFPLCCIFYYVFLWQPYYHLLKGRRLGVVRTYHRFTHWICEKRGVGQPKMVKVQFDDDPVEIEVEVIYPTFARIACPYCLLFSKPVQVTKCDCKVSPNREERMNKTTKYLIRTIVWVSLIGGILTKFWMIGSLWLLVMGTKWWKEVWQDEPQK